MLSLIHYGETAIKALIPFLAVDDEQTKWRVIFAISRFGASAIGHLIDALRDPKLRENAAKCLSLIVDPRIKKPHVADILIKALEDEDEYVRSTAVELLGEIGDERAIDQLITKLKDEKSVREKAKWALAFMGKRSIRYLAPLLRETDWKLRRAAFEILTEIGDDAVDTLIECLRDELWFVRKEAAEALGAIGNEKAIKHLQKLLKDRDVDIREVARSSLRRIDMEQLNS